MDKEKFTANPYNKNNKLIECSDIINIMNKHNINNLKINNINIYQTAFVHKSYCKLSDYSAYKNENNSLELQDKSYETLEFLGDSILGSIVSKYLYERYHLLYNVDEGFLTKIKNRIVNGTMLGYLSDKLNLNKFLIISEYIEEQCNGRNNERILEDIFEALIGAIFLDTNDYDLTKQFIINIIESYIDFTNLIINDTNYKDQLWRYMKKTYDKYPEKNTINVEDEYLTQIKNGEEIIGEFKSDDKKESEQLASREALKHYGILN